jgi:hypothetical protein
VDTHGVVLASALAELSFDANKEFATMAKSLLKQLGEGGKEQLIAIGKAYSGEVGVACWMAACDIFRIEEDLPSTEMIVEQIVKQSRYRSVAADVISRPRYAKARANLTEEFRKGLASPGEFSFRQSCLFFLMSIRPVEQETIDAMTSSLSYRDVLLARQTAAALKRMGADATNATPQLIAWFTQRPLEDVLAVRRSDVVVGNRQDFREFVADILVKISPDPKYAPLLVDIMLDEREARVHFEAASILRVMGPEGVALLHPHVRGEKQRLALDALKDIRPSDEATARVLLDCFMDFNYDDRKRAAAALQAMGPGAIHVFDPIYAALSDASGSAFQPRKRGISNTEYGLDGYAASLLVSMKPGPEYAPKLAQLLTSRLAAGSAGAALENMGGEAMVILPDLLRNLQSTTSVSHRPSLAVIRAIGVKDEKIASVVAPHMASRDSWVRQSAAETLVMLESAARPAKSALIAALVRDTDMKLRITCIRALIQIGQYDEAQRQALQDILKKGGPNELEYYASVALDLNSDAEDHYDFERRLAFAARSRDSWLAGAAALCLVERGYDAAQFERQLQALPVSDWNRERLKKFQSIDVLE